MTKVVDSSIMAAARKTVKQCLAVVKNEEVVLLTDEERLPIARALTTAVIEQRAQPSIFILTENQIDYFEAEIPNLLSHALKRADVLVALYGKSLKRKSFMGNMFVWLMENYPCRIAPMPGITVEAFCESMRADFNRIENLSERLVSIFLGNRSIEVSTEKGTNLSFLISSSEFASETSSGIVKELHSIGNIPGAEIYAIPLPGTAQGTIVVDGSMPNHKIDSPFRLEIEDGRVVKIRPRLNRFGKKLGASFRKFGKCSRVVAEFGIGLSDAIKRLRGLTLLDEKMLGTCHFGLGGNTPFGGPNKCGVHIDLVILSPTIRVDGHTIMSKGNLTFNLKDFQRSYKDVNSQGVEGDLLVIKETNKVYSIKGETFKVFWKGGAGKSHFTSIFDAETSALAVRVWNKLSAVGKTTGQIREECGLDQDSLTGILLLLKEHGLVDFVHP